MDLPCVPSPFRRALARLGALLVAGGSLVAADFSEIEPLLRKHCVECHGAGEPDGGLVLESYESLLRGGESGPAIRPGQAAVSLLVQAVEGRWDRTGKNQFMPPGKKEKLPPAEIARLRAWIDAGALPSREPPAAAAPAALVVPKIPPRTPPRKGVQALAYHAGARQLAVARAGAVEIVDAATRRVLRTLEGHRGVVNDLAFSADGLSLFAAGGEPGQFGEVREWRFPEGTLVRIFTGHRDAIQAVAVSATPRLLATGSYDHGIELLDLDAAGSGTNARPVRSIRASQGAILGLAFRLDGRVLASVSHDRTAKIFDPATGTRLETFGQALKELNAVAFSPDGRRLLTGGNDNRIRAYRIGATGREGENTPGETVFAHEGGILRLAWSPDGRTVASGGEDRMVKLFDATGLRPLRQLEVQPDWPAALVFAGADTLVVGRADGTLGWYASATGQARTSPTPAPAFKGTEPRGVQRGRPNRLKLVGGNLEGVTVATVSRGDRLIAALVPERRDGEWFIELEPDAAEPRGPWGLSVSSAGGESDRVRLWVDDLPQVTGPDALRGAGGPVSAWGALVSLGKADSYRFQARAGETWVLDLAGKSVGSDGVFTLALVDGSGRVLARDDNAAQVGDPWLAHTFAAGGEFTVQVGEVPRDNSAPRPYRLSAGRLPFVTGLEPLVVPARSKTQARLVGFNLPEGGRVEVVAGDPGELGLPGPAMEYRGRRAWRWLVTDLPVISHAEAAGGAGPGGPLDLPVPVSINAAFEEPGDADVFRFTARRGATYLLETTAAQAGSPADTRLEVLGSDGRPLVRTRLQALRNSAITFRPETSDDPGIRFENWEEMELNDLLWCGGEVMKLFRAPQGPDSDSLLYASNGRRRGWFDTSPVAHPLDEPVYLVRPLDPGEPPVPNGLPVFTVPYENDDDALRLLGSDSRLLFTAPADGPYRVRVTEARGEGGAGHQYRLVVREAQPAFRVALPGFPSRVAAGSGQPFTVTANRLDGFEGAIRVDLGGLPDGWSVPTPLVIEAGHQEAVGVLRARTNAVAPGAEAWAAVTITATARVEGRLHARAADLPPRPSLDPGPPKLEVRLEPAAGTERE
ncbi:MAG: c-type cytochrome domain-containing protein, partial [Verrucomicrobiota bacterium]